jgi:hypothetical protein
MARIAFISFVLFLVGCRSTEKTTYSTESTMRTAINPYDCRSIDKVDVTVTIRKSW